MRLSLIHICTLESLLLSVESVFTCLPAVEVNEETRRRLLNGAPTYRFPARDGRYRALCAGEFLGVCRVEKHIPVSYTHLDVYKRQTGGGQPGPGPQTHQGRPL